jgi:hypothetical protein
VRSGRSEIAAPTHATQFIHLAPAPRSYHARRNQIFRIATWRERWRNPLQQLKGNAAALKKIDDAEELLKSLRKALDD